MSNILYYYTDNNIEHYYLIKFMFLIKQIWNVRVIDIETSIEENINDDFFKKNSRIIPFDKAHILIILNKNKSKYKNTRLIKYSNIEILLYDEIYYIIKNWKHFHYIVKYI